MRQIVQRNQFRREYKRQGRRGKNLDKLDVVVSLLSRGGTLGAVYRSHKLSGKYEGLWECHIESDWLLIFDVTVDAVVLYRTGTHADLFE